MAPSVDTMKQAAACVSRILGENQIEHAFIGGFALRMLGHERSTIDIDVEIGIDNAQEMRSLVTRVLRDADSRFVVSHMKLFFVLVGNGQLRVPVETLARGALNLPRQLPVICPGDASVPILLPGVLILTKIKRCTLYIGRTPPQSIAKHLNDVRDIIHLLYWLVNHEQKIDFAAYDAAFPDRLYEAVRKLGNRWVEREQHEDVALLDRVLEDGDKTVIMDYAAG
ncbi:hypothetical protein CGRA01v4_14970 [Colletotrichum graminicola]|uniref:Nucleotidyl transferase AbiEii/AbiGii toxin family protein n=1 Tax=Colletotrichum graminicola (strain M1.001 / M2 / FGSC 10212) TaxID=645133 RepID=E3QZG0_COLGM|nr:uncharacterized protein GLRG_11393 [Colletotrichum graminicola M1.001]EFQ36248.1 hypothetical protein GLRG_11393 [Colletotrichum graminicola M1.001]WDK23678.1 hypothetical protein CGRA01v4_14970 [Colletotrichum graminicola]